MNLRPLNWQLRQWEKISQAIAGQHLAHGLLFFGPNGIGKKWFAEALSARLLCQSSEGDGACGKCTGCRLLKSGTHPDFLLIEPEGSRVIKIDQIRALGDFAVQTAQQAGYKVIIIDQCESLNMNAANALLKNLEEPGGNTLLILITHAQDRVLPTIRSRCQLLDFQCPTFDDAREWLQQQSAELPSIDALIYAGGAPLKAAMYVESNSLADLDGFMSGLVELVENRGTALTLADRIKNMDPLMIVDQLMRQLHLAMVQSVASVELPASMREKPIIEALKRVSAERKFLMQDRLAQVKQDWLSGANPNRQLMLETLLLDWRSAIHRR